MNKALVIGINNYSDGKSPLNGCINDTQLLANTLLSRGFNTKDIKLLYDGYANKENIIKSIKWLKKGSGKKVFYFSGHGSQIVDIEQDEIDGLDEIFYTYDSFITDDELYNLTKRDEILFIFDSCHSGTINRSKEQNIINTIKDLSLENNCKIRTIPRETGFNYYQKNLKPIKVIKENKYYISACADNETAKELVINNEIHGVFTYNFCDLMNKYPKYGFKKIFSLLKDALKEYDQVPQTNTYDVLDIL